MAHYQTVLSKLHKSLIVAIAVPGVSWTLFVLVVASHDSWVTYRALAKYNEWASEEMEKFKKEQEEFEKKKKPHFVEVLPPPFLDRSKDVSSNIHEIMEHLNFESKRIKTKGYVHPHEAKIRDSGISCSSIFIGSLVGNTYGCAIRGRWSSDDLFTDFWSAMIVAFASLVGTSMTIGVLIGLKVWMKWLIR